MNNLDTPDLQTSGPTTDEPSVNRYGPDHRPPRERDPRKISAEQYLALDTTPADQMGECTSCNRRRLRAGLLETPTGLQCPHCHGGDD